jgi:hypothetical protein
MGKTRNKNTVSVVKYQEVRPTGKHKSKTKRGPNTKIDVRK